MEDEKKVVPVEENSTEAEATVSEPEAVEEASPAEDPKVEESENFDDSNASGFDKFFGISKRKTTLRIEIIAGIVTFLAMCYILVVNPNNIIDAYGTGGNTAGVTWGSVFMATAFGAVIGTLLMALVARMPLAQAPGMGLNFTVGTAFLGAFGGILFTFGQTMLLVLISGIIFLLLSFIPGKRDKETGRLIALRELIFDGMPECIRKAIPVGIGLFIAFIGLKNSSVITANLGTFVQFVTLNTAEAWELGGTACNAMVCLFGFIVICILEHFHVKGGVIIGILAATILAIPLKVANLDILAGKGETSWKFWENFKEFFTGTETMDSAFVAVFRDGFSGWDAGMIMTAVVLVITFCMIDMFDTMGTVVGCTTAAGLIDKNGKPENYNKIMVSDSVATVAGAVLGTSTVTTFVESGSGIAAGGKTGIVALTAAALFFLAVFVAPLFEFIPMAACAPALIYVGVLMMKNVVNIDFSKIKYAAPAFLTIIMMPLAYSITTGIGIGIISFVIINFVTWLVETILYKAGKREEKPNFEISIVLFIIFILFLVYFLLPTSF